MNRISERIRIIIVWILFIMVFIVAGILLNNRLSTILKEYANSQVCAQADYVASAVSDELFREIDKLRYISKVVESHGSADKHALDAVRTDNKHQSMGLQALGGNAISGEALDVSVFSGIQDAFRGNTSMTYVKNEGMLFSCPVYNKKNVKYVVYELFDEYGLRDTFSLLSKDNRKIVITTRGGDIIMPFSDVTDNEVAYFESRNYRDIFNDLSRSMELRSAAADFYTIGGETFIFFTADIPYTPFRLQGYMEPDMITSGLMEASTIVIYAFAFLLILYAVGSLYLIIATEKAEESDALRKAKQQAEDANRAKSDFLASMSHEIRTPINAVLGMDEMIIRESDNEHILEYATNINNAGKSLLNLINDILDFSKIEAGKMEILSDEYKTSFLITDLVNMVAVRAHNKGLEFIVNADPQLPSVLLGDEERVKQCILNILTNAVKYTEKGSVTFNLGFEKASDDEILLDVSVKDTGIGIKPADQERLFSPFERVDLQRNRSVEGTGLGLSIVKNLLNLMGTQLELSSEYGKGSEFSFRLKQRVMEWKSMGDFAEAYKKSILTQNKYTELFRAPDASLLVVDDTEMNLTVFKGLLKKTRIRIDTALSGNDALKLVRSHHYDLMFIDHRMPVMDGIDTLKAMNEMSDNKCKGVPCIAFTANAGAGSRDKYRSYGFDDYISKPVSPSELEELIIKYLPPDKIEIIDPDEAAEGGDKNDVAENDEKFIKSYQAAENLSYNVAIASCGDTAVLKDSAITFYKTIDERAEEIRTLADKNDIKNYTIKVHALKSSARIVGAVNLSVKAEYLERCGNENKVDEIMEKTDELLEDYLALKSSMSFIYTDYLKKDESDGEAALRNLFKEALRRETLMSFILNVRNAVENFDYDSITGDIQLIREYKLTAELEAELDRLADGADSLDEEKVMKSLDKLEKIL
ncbi:MAG: response regulator [Lachnospiraceae bacterium]|nr:response regulator [Lachnospiraceae bacterium]